MQQNDSLDPKCLNQVCFCLIWLYFAAAAAVNIAAKLPAALAGPSEVISATATGAVYICGMDYLVRPCSALCAALRVRWALVFPPVLCSALLVRARTFCAGECSVHTCSCAHTCVYATAHARARAGLFPSGRSPGDGVRWSRCGGQACRARARGGGRGALGRGRLLLFQHAKHGADPSPSRTQQLVVVLVVLVLAVLVVVVVLAVLVAAAAAAAAFCRCAADPAAVLFCDLPSTEPSASSAWALSQRSNSALAVTCSLSVCVRSPSCSWTRSSSCSGSSPPPVPPPHPHRAGHIRNHPRAARPCSI